MDLITCKRCSKKYSPQKNKQNSCNYHPLTFVCRPHPVDHYAYELNDKLMKELKTWNCEFWDCCGKENRSAEGCKYTFHISYNE